MENAGVETMRSGEALVVKARDGYPLAATRFAAGDVADSDFAATDFADRNPAAHTTLIVASATAVPQGLYRRFARVAASRGFETYTFDYRGVGASKPGSLRGFNASFLDWARLDLAGVIDEVRVSGRRTVLVGHSFGGQALGLLPEPESIDAMFTFGTGTGWHGFMSRREALRVRALWQIVAPTLARRHGYLPWSLVGNGEDVPLGVYRQWKNWCMREHHFFDDPAMPEIHELFARITSPIAAANSTDDQWVPPRSRDAFFRGYANAPLTAIDISPVVRDLPALGHMGYFRAAAEPLWHDALDWFDEHASRPTA